MKVFCVLSIGRDAEYNKIETLEYIFSTRELADNYVNHEIGTYTVEEMAIQTEDFANTKRTMENVKSGKIIMKNGAMIFKS